MRPLPDQRAETAIASSKLLILLAQATFIVHISVYHNILWSKYKGSVFSELSQIGASRGVEVSFVQIAETEEQREHLSGIDYTYHTYPFRLLFRGVYERISPLHIAWALAKDLIKHPSDLVLLPNYDLPEYWAMMTVCILLRRKRAVVCDATRFDRPQLKWKEYLKRWFFARCHGLFCYGTRSKEYLMSYGVSESKINFRCQAAALPHDYDPNAILRHYATSAQFDPNHPRFLFVGRLSPEKGLFDLLDAFSLLRERLPHATLDLVGAGPLQAELDERIGALGLRDAARLKGSLDLAEITAELYSATALVLPSHSEPWGLVVNEALSYGCPVVVSDHCGCLPELVIDGVTGYSFKTGDIRSLAAAMQSVTELSTRRASVAASTA